MLKYVSRQHLEEVIKKIAPTDAQVNIDYGGHGGDRKDCEKLRFFFHLRYPPRGSFSNESAKHSRGSDVFVSRGVSF